MSTTRVSVVVPARDSGERPPSVATIERYLASTGLQFEVMTTGEPSYGAALRRGASEAKGSVVVFADAELPYSVSAIGDAVAMIESGATDVVFGCTRANDDPRHWLLRTLLVPILPDPALHLKAFSSTAAKLILGETKIAGGGCDLELAFLANKYGFRIERLVLQPTSRAPRTFGAIG